MTPFGELYTCLSDFYTGFFVPRSPHSTPRVHVDTSDPSYLLSRVLYTSPEVA